MFRRSKRLTLRGASFLALLLALGFLGNYYNLSLCYGANFLFGSIAVLLVLYFYGLGWGMLAGLVAYSYTFFLWGHPYGFVILMSETLFVGVLLRSGRRNLLLVDGLFWLVIGIPLVGLFYGLVMRMNVITVLFMMFKGSLNGIFNALLANLAISYLPFHLVFASPDPKTQKLQNTLFNLIVALVLFPAMIMMVLEIRSETVKTKAQVANGFEVISAQTQFRLRSWYERRLRVLRELAALAGETSMTPSGQLQHETEIFRKSFPDFLSLHVENAQGVTIAYSPKVKARGKPVIGVDFSQRPWFKKIKATRHPVVSQVCWDRMEGSIPIIFISVPVLRENRLVGSATGALNPQGLQELFVSCMYKNLNMILLDSQDRVIASSSSKWASMQSYYPDKTIISRLKGSAYQLISGANNLPSLTRWKNSFYAQETIIGQNLPWKLVLESPVAPQQRRLYLDYVKVFSTAVCLAAGAMLLALLLSRWIARPLEKLAKATTDIPGKLLGSSEINWPKSSAQEIHSLIGNFRLMARVLDGNFQEIQEKSTRLVKANQELQKEIRDRVSAQEALRESEQQLANIINFLPDATLVIDTAGKVIAWNKAAEEMTGIKSEDILGKDNYEYAMPFYGCRRPMLIDLVLKPAAEIESLYEDIRWEDSVIRGENYVVSLNNRQAWLVGKASVLRDSNGQIIGAIESIRDITERHQMEESLRQSEQRFRLLAETIQDVFWIVSPGFGEVIYVSPAYETVWGRPRDELYREPKSFAEAIHPKERESVLAQIMEAHAQGQPWNLEYRISKPDGKVSWIRERGYPIREEQGDKVLFAGVCTDITEQRILESQLIQAQKMEAVGRLAGGIAHDFNNILTAIMGYTELLSMKFCQDGQPCHEVAEVQKSAERAATLTHRLLAFSRKQIFRPKVLDLNELVSNLDNMLRRLLGEDIELVTILNPELGKVMADPGQIEQVLMNLVVNARDAMPRGGKLTMATADVDLNEDYTKHCLDEVNPGAYVMIAVSDTGEGMEADIVSHIFEPFFTTKEVGQGSGLGLSMVHGIVKQSGGHVSAYSEPGLGTTFKIYLPRMSKSGNTAEEINTARVPNQGSETILLVEDEDQVRKVIRRGLEINGYKVLDAGSGSEAQLLSQQHGGPIHLLLTDVVMPEMSGREVADHLLARRPEMKVLYMSGHTENTIIHHGGKGPNLIFIQKPFGQNALLAKIRQTLDSA